MEQYEIDTTGTEDDMIERETDKALGAGAMSAAAVRGAVGPLVRIILALLAAIGAKSVREALARAKAWTAPVDVEAEVERAANEIREGREALPDRPMTDVIRPLVTDRARLAREVERLRGERRRTEQALRSDIAAFREDRNAARAELARLTSDLDSLAQDVGQALCAATLRPGETITDQRPHAIVSLVVDLVGEKHAMAAEIARLTAAPGEAWERLATIRKALLRLPASRGHVLPEPLTETEAIVWARGARHRADRRMSLDPIAAALRDAWNHDVPPEVRPVAPPNTECPGPHCVMCSGEACALCGAGTRTRGRDDPRCDHDVIDRHRDAIPPEVRPTCPGCFTGGEDAHPRSERCSGARPEAPEMAVTTGEAERAPDACGHGTLSSWPCDDCEREMVAPTAVPGIAGPAGLDLASAPPAEYWDKGVAVERQSSTAQCVAVLVTDPADRVLLVLSGKRHGRHSDRAWELPDGKIHDGEDPREAARREVREEAGLAVVLSTDDPTVLPPSARHRGALLFRGRAEGEPRPGSDAMEAMWFSANDVLWLDAHHMPSDLASRAVLLAWARGGLSPAADATTHGPETRPRVGAWSAWEPACGASIYDDHGLIVASAWETPDGWRWSANRAHRAPAQGGPVPSEGARQAALDVLATWCDVSTARGGQ